MEDDHDRLAGIIALADVARELGRREPERVVDLLEQISEPATDRTPATMPS
jgi:L-2-hydroxyglutarate oxidase LhgO